ncbi:hypothetical protein AB0L74_00895 [Streptomyces sp. NPDC052020]|uniref:hypothetical protein n=1 Tax=Streptomyces sp. NPDC052020 TaxID=3155677 RepID=UPI00341C7298
MALKKALACTFTALALSGSAAGAAVAADDDDRAKFDNSAQILSCDTIEVIDIPIVSSANNNIDCSENEKKVEKTQITVVDDSEQRSQSNVFVKSKKHHDYR